MSIHVASLVKRRVIGSPTRKAVLMHMADYASDDGSGVWTSKSKMAEELEMGRRTVQECIDSLIEAGLIETVGKRAIRNGYTEEYRLVLDRIKALPEVGTVKPKARQKLPETTCAGAAHVREPHATCAGAAQQDVREPHINRPRTILEHGGGGSASARDENRTLLEQVCEAAGSPLGSMTVRGGGLGSQADGIEVSRWKSDLGLTDEEILASIREQIAGKPDGPPARLSYFTKGLQRFAGRKARGPLTPIEGGQARASPGVIPLDRVAANALAQLHAEDTRKASRQ